MLGVVALTAHTSSRLLDDAARHRWHYTWRGCKASPAWGCDSPSCASLPASASASAPRARLADERARRPDARVRRSHARLAHTAGPAASGADAGGRVKRPNPSSETAKPPPTPPGTPLRQRSPTDRCDATGGPGLARRVRARARGRAGARAHPRAPAHPPTACARALGASWCISHRGSASDCCLGLPALPVAHAAEFARPGNNAAHRGAQEVQRVLLQSRPQADKPARSSRA